MVPEGSQKVAKGISAEEKRIILTGQITLYCTAFALLHFFIDFSQGMFQSALSDASIGLAVFVCYGINRLKYHRLAKLCCLAMLNISLSLYASVVPREVGVYLFYFPLIAVSSALFGKQERKLRYIFVLLPFIFLLVLFVTDFNLFDGYQFEQPPGSSKMFFVINLVSSGFVMTLCINFMLNLNEHSESQLQRMALEMNAKNEALERTNSELDRFLYSTSHDLQSPLSSIKGLINVARYDTRDEKVHLYLDKMTERVNGLEGFIRDIIDYSKNARTDLQYQQVDFSLLVNEVTENLKYIPGADAIEIRRDVKVDHPVSMDRSRVSVVLANLIGNAIKYHDHSKADRWIEVSISNSQNSVKVKVSDNGTGIALEQQPRIFDMFYRGTVQSTGSGLGLYIVKQAVEKMQGHITVDSIQGVGSSFLVSLPIS